MSQTFLSDIFILLSPPGAIPAGFLIPMPGYSSARCRRMRVTQASIRRAQAAGTAAIAAIQSELSPPPMIMHATAAEQSTSDDTEARDAAVREWFTYRFYQKDDLARLALQPGGILGWDPGLGKTMAGFTFPMLKKAARSLLVVPAALHEQMIDEGRVKFGVNVRVLQNQEDAYRYMREGVLPFPHAVDPTPRRMGPGGRFSLPDFFITAYNWLGYEGGDEWDAEEPNELIRLRRLRIARTLIKLADPADGELIIAGTHRPKSKDTAWSVIGIPQGSDLKTIKTAWRTAAKLYHPDLHPRDATAGSRFQLLNAAFRLLTGQDEQEFGNQLRALEKEPDLVQAVASMQALEAGIGTTRTYSATATRPAQSITCVFMPTLSTLVRSLFDSVTCDEGVRLKSGTAFQALGVLNMDCLYPLVLSGTPIKNKLPDLFFLASFVTGRHARGTARWPYGNTTEDRAQFASDFGVMEENLTKNEQEKKKNGGNRRFTKVTPKICNVHRLWRILGPVVIRRRKDNVPGCDIVGKKIVPVRVMPGTAQKKVYQFQLGNPPPYANFLAQLGAQLQCLRQSALFPASPSLARIGIPQSRSDERFTPKSAGILQLAKDLMEQGEQLVIFSPFTDFSDDLSARFTEAAVPHLKLDGQTSPTKRGTQIKRFKSGEIPILIAGINSMGEGHNLDNASHLVLPSVDWAYDANSQAVERVHRLTSRKDVTIYVMVTKGTIDERLTALWQEKGDASDLALDGRLIEHEKEDIDLAKLLSEAVADFDPTAATMDESEVERTWATTLLPALSASFATYRSLRPIKRDVPEKTKQPTTTPDTAPTTRHSLLPAPRPAHTPTVKPLDAPSPTPTRRLSLFELMNQKRTAPPAPQPDPAPPAATTPTKAQVQSLRSIIPFPGRLGTIGAPKIPVVVPDFMS